MRGELYHSRGRASADASDDLMAGLMAAGEAEHKPAPLRKRGKHRRPTRRSAKPPARPPAKKPPALEGVADDFGEMDLSPPIAPAMGAAPPAPLRPAAQPPSGPGRPQARRVVVARQAQPLRPNEEHENKFLAWLDGTLMTVGQAVFWLMVLYILFISDRPGDGSTQRGGGTWGHRAGESLCNPAFGYAHAAVDLDAGAGAVDDAGGRTSAG